MLTIYETRSGILTPQKGQLRVSDEAVWLDLLSPTPEEEELVQAGFKN